MLNLVDAEETDRTNLNQHLLVEWSRASPHEAGRIRSGCTYDKVPSLNGITDNNELHPRYPFVLELQFVSCTGAKYSDVPAMISYGLAIVEYNSITVQLNDIAIVEVGFHFKFVAKLQSEIGFEALRLMQFDGLRYGFIHDAFQHVRAAKLTEHLCEVVR